MAYSAKVFKVMIASPSDLEVERGVVREVIAEWNVIHSEVKKSVVLPVGWETHTSPEMGSRPQEIINRQILEGCDLLVGIFWTRIGTATGEYASGTVEEIERHMRRGRPAMLYFSSALVDPEKIDSRQYSILKDFKESCRSRGVYESFSSVGDFRAKFNRHLQIKLGSDPYFTVDFSDGRGDRIMLKNGPSRPNLSLEAQALLKEAGKGEDGVISSVALIGGFSVKTNGRQFVETGNPRSRAIWEAAVHELESAGLISGGGGDMLNVTNAGYRALEIPMEDIESIHAKYLNEISILQRKIDERPLTQLQKRNKCDELLESGRSIYNYLKEEGSERDLDRALKWFDELNLFCDSLKISEADLVNAHERMSEVIGVAADLDFSQSDAAKAASAVALRLMGLEKLRKVIKD